MARTSLKKMGCTGAFMTILTCSALLLESCYSYSSMTSEEYGEIFTTRDRHILITLNDSSTVEVSPFHYIRVVDPADFVYGVGVKREKGKKDSEWFCGTVDPVRIDSSFVPVPEGSAESRVKFYSILTADSSRVSFQKGDCFFVTKGQGSGLWCNGQRETRDGSRDFTGRIAFGKILSVKVLKFAWIKTIWNWGGLSIAIAAFIGFVTSKDTQGFFF
jgi:hypothetical protein